MIAFVPMACETCGGQGRLKVVGDALVCPLCGGRRAFVRPPLMVIAGAGGSGKSTLCSRLAGSIDDVVAIDADVFSKDLISVVSPNRDYPSFWRSLMQFAHEISQNGVIVAYLGVTLPEQVLANRFSMSYFSAVHFLGLVCDESDLRSRILSRAGGEAAGRRVDLHLEINRRLRDAAAATAGMILVDGSQPRDVVEHEVRAWVAGVRRSFEARIP